MDITQPASIAMTKALTCTEFAPPSVPFVGHHEMNFWQYNYMMQLQRDSIRAQVFAILNWTVPRNTKSELKNCLFSRALLLIILCLGTVEEV